MIPLYVCGIVIILLVILEAYDRTQPKYLVTKKLSGPGIHFPIIGNSYMFAKCNDVSGFTTHRALAKKYPGGYYYYYFRTLLYTIHNAESYEEIFSLTNTKKGFFYNFIQPFVGQGILTSFSTKWFERRRLITPAFHFRILQKFSPCFQSHSNQLVNELKTKQNQKVDVQQMFADFSLKLICETSIGIPIGNADYYHKSLSEFGHLAQQRIFSFWSHPSLIYRLLGYARPFENCAKRLHDFTKQLITRRRNEFQLDQHRQLQSDSGTKDASLGYKKNQTALLDTLLAAQIEQNAISDEGIQEEVDTFVFTGHDTVAAAMTYVMLCIAEHPDVQQKVYDEIESVCTNEETLTNHHIASCTYLDMVVKESLRLLPPVPLIIRTLLEDSKINGVMLPAGTDVVMYIVDLHRDERWFPEPEKFIPERFLPENVATRHRFAYVPFSAGVRNCIGQKYALLEMKTMLITVLRAFRLEAVTKIKDLIFVTDMILHTNHPIEIRFFLRKTFDI